MSLSVFEATLQNQQLARLQSLTRASSLYLAQVQALIPPALRASTKAGPITTVTTVSDTDPAQQTEWCLIVASNAGASKMRQLLPKLLQQLQSAGHPVSRIRLSIEKAPPGHGGASS